MATFDIIVGFRCGALYMLDGNGLSYGKECCLMDDGNVCAAALSYGEAGRLDSGSRGNVVSSGSRKRTEQRNWW